MDVFVGTGLEHGHNVAELDFDELLATGPRDQWYPVLPSHMVGERDLVKVTRLGKDWLLFRDTEQKVHMLANRCPHRNAPLSTGDHYGDRVRCQYHGVEVDGTGTVRRVPGLPGCSLEGRQATLSLEVVEELDTIFAFFPLTATSQPTPFKIPDRLDDPEQSWLPCYTEWKTPWRIYIENLCDPMHGVFLHQRSHSMSGGAQEARFRIQETPRGFLFEKMGQKGTNFDSVEFVSESGLDYVDLEIPYGKGGGPGGPFGIVGIVTPVTATESAVFQWRTRRVSGWERDVWRFLYRAVLEGNHWEVLEQDRVLLEQFALDADRGERLYEHDLGVTRVRRRYRNAAKAQAAHLESLEAGRRARRPTASDATPAEG